MEELYFNHSQWFLTTYVSDTHATFVLFLKAEQKEEESSEMWPEPTAGAQDPLCPYSPERASHTVPPEASGQHHVCGAGLHQISRPAGAETDA